MTDHEPEDRQQEVRSVVLKFLGVIAAVGVVIWIVTLIVVSSLDLNSTSGPVGSTDPVPSLTPLPTSAITESPTQPANTPSAEPTDLLTELPTDLPTLSSSDIQLSASPVFVGPMQRINLEGSWPGHDGVSLSVQRFEGGEWVDFGVQANVKIGSYKTYVETSHEGVNRFRMYDPASGTASNEVPVTIGA